MASTMFLVVLVLIMTVLVFLSMRKKTRDAPPPPPLHVVCIHLPDQIERRKNMIQQTQGLTVHFIDAVDTRGQKWKNYLHHLDDQGRDQVEYAVTMNARREHKDLTPGAVGCFLSHLKCYSQFQKDHLDALLVVMEDDNEPSRTFTTQLDTIASALPPDTDLCLLHHEIHGYTIPSTHDARFLELDPSDPDSKFYRLNCYIVTPQGVDKILSILDESNGRFHDQIDSYMTGLVKEGRLRVYFWHDTTVSPPSSYGRTTVQTIPVPSGK